MPSSRPFFTAVVVVLLLVAAATPASAILLVFPSLDRTPFAMNDAAETRQRVESALRLKECQFAGGSWCNGNWTLNYQGQTAPLNDMVRQLTECPDLSVEVSFNKLDDRYDWQIIRHHQDKLLRVIVNLNSQNIALAELMIPSTTGPEVDPPSK